MTCRLLQLLVLVISVYSFHGGTIRNTEKLAPTADFPNFLAKSMQSGSFPLFIVGAASPAMAFISNIIAFVDLIHKFTGNNEPKELLEMKSFHKEMSKRFDEVNLQLKDIKMEIEWSEIVSELGHFEQDINANYDRLQSIMSGPVNMTKSASDDFLAGYRISCINCAMKLYQGIKGNNGIFNGDILFRKVEQVLKYDRRKMQNFMIGIFQLLIKGVSSELLYDKMVHGDAYFKLHHDKWFERVKAVTSHMKLVDMEVKNKWYEQTGTDIDDASVKYTSQSNQNFSSTLHKFLTKKYFWRDWLVIVYKPISDTKNHKNFVCNGYTKYRLHGRNVVVASVDDSRETINTTEALANIQDTKTIISSKDPPHFLSVLHINIHIKHDHKLNAADLYTDLPKNCSMYASVGVIDSWVDLWYQGPPERLVHMRTPGRNSYSLHYFG